MITNKVDNNTSITSKNSKQQFTTNTTITDNSFISNLENWNQNTSHQDSLQFEAKFKEIKNKKTSNSNTNNLNLNQNKKIKVNYKSNSLITNVSVYHKLRPQTNSFVVSNGHNINETNDNKKETAKSPLNESNKDIRFNLHCESYTPSTIKNTGNNLPSSNRVSSQKPVKLLSNKPKHLVLNELKKEEECRTDFDNDIVINNNNNCRLDNINPDYISNQNYDVYNNFNNNFNSRFKTTKNSNNNNINFQYNISPNGNILSSKDKVKDDISLNSPLINNKTYNNLSFKVKNIINNTNNSKYSNSLYTSQNLNKIIKYNITEEDYGNLKENNDNQAFKENNFINLSNSNTRKTNNINFNNSCNNKNNSGFKFNHYGSNCSSTTANASNYSEFGKSSITPKHQKYISDHNVNIKNSNNQIVSSSNKQIIGKYNASFNGEKDFGLLSKSKINNEYK